MKRDGVDLVERKLLDETVGAASCPHEHECQPALAAQELGEGLDLVVRLDGDEAMLDLAVRPRCRAVPPRSGRGRVVYTRASSPTLAVESRREEHGLPLTRHAAKDAVDLWLESHVEHPVGLVENEDPDAVEGDGLALEEVVQAAGRRDEKCARRARLAWACTGTPP